MTFTRGDPNAAGWMPDNNEFEVVVYPPANVLPFEGDFMPINIMPVFSDEPLMIQLSIS
jgi:hypothetical protein